MSEDFVYNRQEFVIRLKNYYFRLEPQKLLLPIRIKKLLTITQATALQKRSRCRLCYGLEWAQDPDPPGEEAIFGVMSRPIVKYEERIYGEL